MPMKKLPVTLPVALTMPVVNKLPPVALPVTAKLVRVPTLVILVCAAVVNVPTMLVPLRLPPVILPVALTNPPDNTLPPVTLALTLTVVPVCVVAFTLAPPMMLPAVILPVVDTGLVPSAARLATTLALPYVDAIPVN